MSLSASRRFLLAACRSGAPTDYFRWREIGAALGYGEMECEQAVRSLDAQKLLILLHDGQARLLKAGWDLAAQLEQRIGAAPERGPRRR
jgi:hypothetical protein